MTNRKTIKERLAVIETKINYLNQWLKGVVVVVLASMGVNIAV